MQMLTRVLNAVYQFVVGDIRILVGTLLALVLTVVVGQTSTGGASVLLVSMLTLTLVWSLNYERTP